jgi:hypothetical protein
MESMAFGLTGAFNAVRKRMLVPALIFAIG